MGIILHCFWNEYTLIGINGHLKLYRIQYDDYIFIFTCVKYNFGIAGDAKHCMVWGAIELTGLTRIAQDAKHFMALGALLKAIKFTRLTLEAQEAKHCMAWVAIEGNRTQPFASGSAGCQLSGVQSKAMKLTRLTWAITSLNGEGACRMWRSWTSSLLLVHF